MLFGYFWLSNRRTIAQTIPCHQSIISLPNRLKNKHAGGVTWYHNVPTTASDNTSARRIQEKLYHANQYLKNPATSLQHIQRRWKTLKQKRKPIRAFTLLWKIFKNVERRIVYTRTMTSQRTPWIFSAEPHQSNTESHDCPKLLPRATRSGQLEPAAQPKHHGSTTQTATATTRTKSRHCGHDQICNEHTDTSQGVSRSFPIEKRQQDNFCAKHRG